MIIAIIIFAMFAVLDIAACKMAGRDRREDE